MYYKVTVKKIEIYSVDATSRSHALSLVLESGKYPYMNYVEDFNIESITKNEYSVNEPQGGEGQQEVAV